MTVVLVKAMNKAGFDVKVIAICRVMVLNYCIPSVTRPS